MRAPRRQSRRNRGETETARAPRHRQATSRAREKAPAGLIFLVAAVAIAAIAIIPETGPRSSGPSRAPRDATPLPRGADGTRDEPPGGRVPLEVVEIGRDERAARIVRPAGATAPLPGVIFLHGWGLVGRAAYRPWIRHLARAGNQVIVPRYQRDASSNPARALSDALAGVRAALRTAPIAPRSLVVAGHSAGGALAADYAASSSRSDLAPPEAIYSVYPGRLIRGYPAGIPQIDPGRIAPETRLVAMAGSADTLVGQAPAQQLVVDSRAIPEAHKKYVLITRPEVADHYGPSRATGAARRVLWRPLDRLIRQVRLTG